MNIKFKILEVYPQDKSILVHYYTDELVADMQSTWDSRAAQLKAENPDWTLEMAMAQAKKEYVPGAVLGVTIYPDPAPTGAALVDYIYSQAPGDWLIIKSKATTTPNTILNDELESLRGQVHTKPVTAQIAPISMGVDTIRNTDFITHTPV
jgi:hypothetical protein